MLEHNSRYYALEEAIHEDENGKQIVYIRRRFLPQGESIPEVSVIRIQPGSRLDLIAAQHLGDPEEFWQVCDANNAMNPFDLVTDSEVDRQLRIPVPRYRQLP